MWLVMKELVDTGVEYNVIKSSHIIQQSLRAVGRKLLEGGTWVPAVSAHEAAYHDYYGSGRGLTCYGPSEEDNKKLTILWTQIRNKELPYLSALPADLHVPIFNGFEGDGCTPDTQGHQRRMVDSACKMFENMKDILKGVQGAKAKKAAASQVIIITICVFLFIIGLPYP